METSDSVAPEVTVVIVHGTYGHPGENWFPWLARTARAAGRRVYVPRLPTPANQSLASWQAAFAEQVGALSKNVILVGHSLGVAFVLRLIEAGGNSVCGAALVSGFVGPLGIERFDRLNASFFARGFDWLAIRSRIDWCRLYHGDDDPYVPLSRGIEVAKALAAEMTVVPSGGHLNHAAGFDRFDVLWSDLNDVIADGCTAHEGPSTN
jgi:predicted alpha/beta hydrolase family esterase